MKDFYNALSKSHIYCLALLLLLLQLSFGTVWAAVPLNRSSGNLLNLDLKVLVAGKPIYLILVEKDFQRLRVIEHDGRPNVVAEYFAATGENLGRKEVEGDEKTPEGVYFITKSYVDDKITVFGNRAFHLNYPNFYDKADGRDGNGIYIHGTNRDLRSNSTNGCITLNNKDLDDLAQFLSVGSIPVVIVSSLYDEVGSKGLYPNLTEGDFSLAKELLVLDPKPDDFEFVSLFLIRAAGHTVAAGEYKAGKVASQSRFSAAYLDISQEKGWFVAKRGPGSDTYQAPEAETVDAVADVVATKSSDNFLEKQAWSELWEPENEDIYLSWYRDSVPASETIAETIAAETQSPAAQGNMVVSAQRSDTKLTYGLIILVACISVGSVLILKRAQPRELATNKVIDDKADQQILRMTAEKLAQEKVIDSIQEELDRARESLKLVQEHMLEEKSLMESDLQTRIDELESALSERQAEVDQLNAEKSAMKLKGMAHLSGQVEELTSLKNELDRVKEQLEESRKDSERVPVLESMISAQKEETNRLAAENAAWKINEAEADASRRSDLKALQSQVATLQAELTEESERRKISEEKVMASADLERQLSASQYEADSLRKKVQGLESSQNKSELEQQITTLRGRVSVYKSELSSEREEREALSGKLKELQDMQQKISADAVSMEQLENENARLNEELSAKDHEEELLLLRERLSSYEGDIASQREDNHALSSKLEALEASLADQTMTNNESLQQLEAELSNERQSKEKLSAQLLELEKLQSDLAEKEKVIADLETRNKGLIEEAAHQNTQHELASLQKQLEEKEASLNSELSQQRLESQKLQDELSAKASRISDLELKNQELQKDAAGKDSQAELAALQERLDEKDAALHDVQRANEKFEDRLAEVEELMLARQVEVTSLTNQLADQKIKEQASAEHITSLQDQLNSLQSTLDYERAEHLAAQEESVKEEPIVSAAIVEESLPLNISEPVVEEQSLEEPSVVDVPPAIEPEQDVAAEQTAVDESLVSHGTQFLPEDVLKKWIGQS